MAKHKAGTKRSTAKRVSKKSTNVLVSKCRAAVKQSNRIKK